MGGSFYSNQLMDWAHIDLEPTPWSISFDDGDFDDQADGTAIAPPTWTWTNEALIQQSKQCTGVITLSGLASTFGRSFFSSPQSVASIHMEAHASHSLVDSAIGGREENRQEQVAEVFVCDQNIIRVDFMQVIAPHQAFLVAQLIYSKLEGYCEQIVVLEMISSFNFVSETPSIRSVAPLLRTLHSLSTKQNEVPALEAPNICDGVPAAFLSLGKFYQFPVEVYYSLVDGYQMKEESLRAFESVFPSHNSLPDVAYQKALASRIKVEANNPLYM